MALSDVNIELDNGAMGQVSATDDGVAGLILSGAAVEGSLELNKVVLFSSTRDLKTYGMTEENNPLACKDITEFYKKAGDGAELYVIIVPEATTLKEMCSASDGSALRKLIDYAGGRIRLVGVNRTLPKEYEPDTADTGIDKDAVEAAEEAHSAAEGYVKKISPFRLLMPALAWDGETQKLFKPREASFNRVHFILASDAMIGGKASPAIGGVLGRAANVPVNQSVARVKSGAMAVSGYMSDGRTPQECAGMLDILDEAGYIFYRPYVKKNGLYLNNDYSAAPASDDYNSLKRGRVIDKAIVLTYVTYIDEIHDDIEVDASTGQLPQAICTYYEGRIDRAIAVGMNGEISGFTSFIDPAQNLLTSPRMKIACKITPKGTLENIDVTLGFENPALKQ